MKRTKTPNFTYHYQNKEDGWASSGPYSQGTCDVNVLFPYKKKSPIRLILNLNTAKYFYKLKKRVVDGLSKSARGHYKNGSGDVWISRQIAISTHAGCLYRFLELDFAEYLESEIEQAILEHQMQTM